MRDVRFMCCTYFNLHFPVGTDFYYKASPGRNRIVTTRSEAYSISGQRVVKINDRPAGVLITDLSEIPHDRR